LPPELYQQAELSLAEYRFDASDDALALADHDRIADREGFLSAEVPSGDDLVAPMQLVAIKKG